MWSSILVNQWPVPAGMTTTSPALIWCATPLRMSEPLFPGPLNSMTVRSVAGRRWRLAMSGPRTSVAEPEMVAALATVAAVVVSLAKTGGPSLEPGERDARLDLQRHADRGRE